MINFAKFREFQLGAVDELLEQREQLTAQHADAVALNTEMDEQLASLAAAQEAEMPERQRLEGESKELMATIHELNKKQHHLQSESRTKRDALTEITHTVQQEIFEISKVATVCRTLEGQIVQSPELLKQEIAMLGTQLEQERENVVVLEKKVRELVVRADTMGMTKGDIGKARKQLDGVEAEIARLNTANENCEQTKDSVVREERLLKESKAKGQQLKRQIEMIAEKIARLSHQQDMKRKAAQESIEQARKEKAALEQKGTSITNSEESKGAQETFRAEVAKKKEEHQQDIATMQDQHAQLVEKIYSYNDSLKASMVAAC